MTIPLLCRQLFAGNRDGLSANEKEEKIASSDNNCTCSIVIVVNQSNHVMHYFDPYSSFSR